ncbi:hypothetical protein ANN_20076 [Periplaneta americana]|uniref:Uncharacterized protein n=1 Tax=Periplaneta americana TaxID=6978 RepID=A0ABQ8SBW5_PERAM|nr:hypothetical protein ANN_20076 [Periplaneta americana]
MSPGSSTDSYPAFELRKTPRKNLNQIFLDEFFPHARRLPLQGSTLKKKSPGRNSIALRLSEATVRSRALRLLSLGPFESIKRAIYKKPCLNESQLLTKCLVSLRLNSILFRQSLMLAALLWMVQYVALHTLVGICDLQLASADRRGQLNVQLDLLHMAASEHLNASATLTAEYTFI